MIALGSFIDVCSVYRCLSCRRFGAERFITIWVFTIGDSDMRIVIESTIIRIPENSI